MSYLVMSRLSSRISHLPREPQKAAIFCEWVTNSLLWFFALLGYWTLPELHAMVELWHLLKSSLRILTRWLQSYLITLLINMSGKVTSIEVSRHFSSSPFKMGFSSPQKFSWTFTMENSLSSILAFLVPNCTVKKQCGSYFGQCCLYNQLTTHRHFQFSGGKMWLCLMILF